MGIKGEEVEGGFPQAKPAFTITLDWGAPHGLGPTTYPKNNLSYVKVQGSIKTAQGSDLPSFEADFVDAGSWVQQEHLPSGEVWMKAESFALLRVVESSSDASVDPETETGMIRLKWNTIGNLPRLKAALEKDSDFVQGFRKDPRSRGTVDSFSFETGDHRYKFLEHAVYIGKSRLVVAPPDGPQGKPRMTGEYHISYVAA